MQNQIDITSLFPKMFGRYNAHMGHEFVDLGLPSGRLWATCNIGSESPTSIGRFFQWGCLDGLKSSVKYDANSYKFYNDPKYSRLDVSDNLLRIEDDAASVNWGGLWHIPTSHDFEELQRYCKITINRNGLTFSIGDKKLFFPMTGYMDGIKHRSERKYGDYWTSTKCDLAPSPEPRQPNYAMEFRFDCVVMQRIAGERMDYALNIRPVI